MTTNFDSGITTAPRNTTLVKSRLPDVTTVHRFFDDMDRLASGDWLAESTATTSPTLTLGQVNGGVVVVTSDSTNSAFAAYYNANTTSLGSGFAMDTTKGAAIKCRLAVDGLTNTGFQIGLRKTIATTPFTFGSSDKAFCFNKAAGSTTLQFIYQNTATATTVSLGAMDTVLSLAAATYFSLGAVYDPITGNINIYVNDALVAVAASGSNLPTGLMAPVMAIANGNAASHTVSVDYLLAEVNRV